MTPNEFVRSIELNQPDYKTLARKEGGDELVAILQKSFVIQVRARPIETGIPDDVLDELFSRFDLTRLDIGTVCFSDLPNEVGGRWIIGTYEADPIVYDSSIGVFVVDHANNSHVMAECASSGASFLDALAHASQYINLCLVDVQAAIEQEEKVIDQCVHRAGGELYRPFFNWFLSNE